MSTPMNKAAAARIQSTTAKNNNGIVSPNSFSARAQSTADKHNNTRKSPAPLWPSKTGEVSGRGRTNNPSKK